MNSAALERFILSRYWWPLVAGVLLAGAGWMSVTRAAPDATTAGGPPPSPHEGFAAPAFSLLDRAGAPVSLTALRGNVIVLNFWASWCAPCRAEMPALERVHQALAGQGLVILGMNTTYQDEAAAAGQFADSLGLSFPLVFDPQQAAGAAYQLRATPTTFFVDRHGVIRSVVVGGPLSEAQIRATVTDLLAEAP